MANGKGSQNGRELSVGKIESFKMGLSSVIEGARVQNLTLEGNQKMDVLMVGHL